MAIFGSECSNVSYLVKKFSGNRVTISFVAATNSAIIFLDLGAEHSIAPNDHTLALDTNSAIAVAEITGCAINNLKKKGINLTKMEKGRNLFR